MVTMSKPLRKSAKIAIVGTAGIPASYGGFETLAEQLVNYSSDKCELHVYCSKTANNNRPKTYRAAQLHYIPLPANGPFSIIYDGLSILHSIIYANTVVLLGVSGACFILPAKLISRRIRWIVNIDGIEWRREKWKGCARFFLRISEFIAVKLADDVIADNIGIQDYLMSRYGVNAKLITYGADHVLIESQDDNKQRSQVNLPSNYSFAVCRIEPENNIELILSAFSEVPEESLIIVGNWAASHYGIMLRKRFGGHPNITLLDPIYEVGLLNSYRACAKCYIHGHSAGGTNPSLVEAMYLGLPIIAFDVIFNRATTFDKARYFRNKEDLMSQLRGMSAAEGTRLGNEMRLIARENYYWGKIAHEYESLFFDAAA